VARLHTDLPIYTTSGDVNGAGGQTGQIRYKALAIGYLSHSHVAGPT
jgi:hypothetical protein